jgi:phosphate transport system substrate-binding protein
MKLLTIIAAITFAAAPAIARDNVQIAGSSTVLPYATIVAEAFGENFDFPTPVVESGGTSSGLKRFCGGVGETTIDIANASRSIRDSELGACAENGVGDIIEIQFGYDGIVFASDINGVAFEFTPADIYLALNADSIAPTWNDVNVEFPPQEILMFIPGTKHGTREVFEEKVMLVGCEMVHGAPLNDAAEDACMSIRTDGVAIDIDGDYTETLSRIAGNSNGIGVFGLSFYENNTDSLQVAPINGVVPSVESISSGDYPISRPLFFYVKAAHLDVIPGLQEYVEFFVSDDIAGEFGPLVAYGLVPDPALATTQETIATRKTME